VGFASRARSHAIPDHRPPGRILYRYLARELVGPTLFSLVGLTTVVLTKELLGYSDLVINRGLGGDAVLQIAFFQVIPLLTLVFPLAVLMGVLVALGRLGADLEILVLETLGVRATRLAGPIGLFALVMSLVCLWLSLSRHPGQVVPSTKPSPRSRAKTRQRRCVRARATGLVTGASKHAKFPRAVTR